MALPGNSTESRGFRQIVWNDSRRPIGISLIIIWCLFEAFRSILAFILTLSTLARFRPSVIAGASQANSSSLGSQFGGITWGLLGSSPDNALLGAPESIVPVLMFIVFLMIAEALIFLVLAYGFLVISAWARKTAIAWYSLLVLLFLLGFAFLVGAEASNSVLAPQDLNVVSAFVSVLIVGYLLRPDVRDYFTRA